MITTIEHTLHDLANLIEALEPASYRQPVAALEQASIGQHSRHIIELFGCLSAGYATGEIYYDRRRRDPLLEQDKRLAILALWDIHAQLMRPDKPLTVYYESMGNTVSLASSYGRELMYNLEHCIHHQALIRVALTEVPGPQLPAHFGVAPSTIAYRQRTAS